MSESFLALCRESFVGVLKTALYASIGTFHGKTLFSKKLNFSLTCSDVEKKVFELLLRYFRRG